MRGQGVRDARAEDALRRGRALFVLGDAARAEDVVAAGLCSAEADGSSIQVDLAAELARVRAATTWDAAATLPAASRAVELARRWDAADHRARLELAKARFMVSTADPRVEAAAAHRGLLAAGELDAALEAASWLVQMNLGARDLGRASALAEATAAAADRLGRGWHAATARWQVARLASLAGDTRPAALEALRRAAVDPALGPHRSQALADYALALADAGELARARAVLPRRTTTAYERSYTALIGAEIALLDGSLPGPSPGGIFDGLHDLLVAWALVRAGGRPGGVGWLPAHTMTGLADERDGVLLLGRGEREAAAEALLAAARKHGDYSMRHALRCLAGAGETLADVGRRREARAVLREAEAISLAGGMLALMPRIRIGLARLTRVAREVEPAPLSPRQCDVLRLVGEGLTTTAIAAELRIAPSSVETHVREARAKLGARTRHEAALAVSHSDATSPPLRPDLVRLAELLACGATVRSAAEALAVSQRTAARRVAELRRATGATSTVAAVSRAIGCR
jgi:DNA-binding NarL/FixJ family response regulator